MCKKMLLAIGVLALVSSTAHAAVMTWTGTISNDWTDGQNWNGAAAPPVAGDFLDIRSDGFVASMPVLAAGQQGFGDTIRMNPGFGTQTPSITINGGTLAVSSSIRIGDAGSGGATFVMNSGVTNVGQLTAVGKDTPGQLLMNGGTLNAGILGLPNWFEGSGTGAGNAFIDGGNLNTTGIIIDSQGNSPTSGIAFTKDLAGGGGLLTDTQVLGATDWTNWQAQVQSWIGGGRITTATGGTVQANFSSVGTTRTTEIFSAPGPTKPSVGVIRWDGWVGPGGLVGDEVNASLSPN